MRRSKKDREYVDKINMLIPLAEKMANDEVAIFGKKFETRNGAENSRYCHCFFTQFFHENMRRLTKKTGIRNC